MNAETVKNINAELEAVITWNECQHLTRAIRIIVNELTKEPLIVFAQSIREDLLENTREEGRKA